MGRKKKPSIWQYTFEEIFEREEKSRENRKFRRDAENRKLTIQLEEYFFSNFKYNLFDRIRYHDGKKGEDERYLRYRYFGYTAGIVNDLAYQEPDYIDVSVFGVDLIRFYNMHDEEMILKLLCVFAIRLIDFNMFRNYRDDYQNFKEQSRYPEFKEFGTPETPWLMLADALQKNYISTDVLLRYARPFANFFCDYSRDVLERLVDVKIDFIDFFRKLSYKVQINENSEEVRDGRYNEKYIECVRVFIDALKDKICFWTRFDQNTKLPGVKSSNLNFIDEFKLTKYVLFQSASMGSTGLDDAIIDVPDDLYELPEILYWIRDELKKDEVTQVYAMKTLYDSEEEVFPVEITYEYNKNGFYEETVVKMVKASALINDFPKRIFEKWEWIKDKNPQKITLDVLEVFCWNNSNKGLSIGYSTSDIVEYSPSHFKVLEMNKKGESHMVQNAYGLSAKNIKPVPKHNN